LTEIRRPDSNATRKIANICTTVNRDSTQRLINVLFTVVAQGYWNNRSISVQTRERVNIGV